MQLEITSEQFNLIQDEIIRLEEELYSMDRNDDPWGIINTQRYIDVLKEILETETITIYMI